MAKESSKDLFHLIKTLTKSEKRYFKIFASRHVIGEENKYVALFEKIESQKEYDENRIMKELSLKEKHLADQKNYLKELLLKSLRIYEPPRSISSQLKEDIKNIEILYKKALYPQAKKILVRSKKVAWKNEKFIELLELLDWEKTLVSATSFLKESEKNLENIYEEEQLILSRQENLSQFWRLYSSMTYHYTKIGLVRDERELDYFEKIMRHPLLASPDNALSYRSKIYYHTVHSLNAYARGNHEQDYEHNRSLVRLMESDPDRIQESPKSYLAALNNLVNVSILQKKYKESFELLNKIKNLPSESEDINLRKFTRAYMLELNLYNVTGRFEKAVEIVPEIEKGLEEYAGKINNMILASCYYSIAYGYFGAGNYQKALQWINRFLNDSEMDIMMETYSYARILSLILHYEMKKYDLLPYLLRSFYRFLRNKNKLYRFESIILRFLTKISEMKSDESLVRVFMQLKEEMLALSTDEYEKRVFEYFNFIAWIDSKITRRSFSEVTREAFLIENPE